MHNRSFLDRIWAERNSDEPRQIYADWLQQQGDPRGELIALQLGPHSPNAVRRLKALLAEHRATWLGSELATGLLNQKFERGFLVSAKVKRDARFRDHSTLTSPELWFVRDLDGHAAALEAAPAMRSIEFVRLASAEQLLAATERTDPQSWQIVQTGPELTYPELHGRAAASAHFRKVPELRVWVWPDSLRRLVELAKAAGWPNPAETARLRLIRGAGFPYEVDELRAHLLATGVADLAREVVTHTYSGGDLLL
ncbi:MAG TPA: TIGR02996 domain-containing protein [Kofleriaceae bacterium]